MVLTTGAYRLLLPLALVAAGCRSAGEREDTERPPNLVVLFADDMGWADLGCQGAEGFATPRLDRMAAEGMRFTSFYVGGPVCTPSRAALLTGCYPKRVGLAHRVLFPYSDTGLHPDEATIAEVLRDAGYATACIGKWHLGHHAEFLPRRQGFDRWFGVPYSNDMDRHVYAKRDFTAPPLALYDDDEVIEESPDQALLTRRYTEEAVRFIAENASRPFFLYLPHTMPHKPLHASADFRGKSELGLYGDVIEELDWSVGAILDALEEHGIDDRTLVLFTSDNGPWRAESSGPLRGRKNTTWEGGMRVPCVVRWPGMVPAGAVCDEVVTALDLLPTAAALAGVAPPEVDGHDVRPLLLGEPNAASPTEAFFYYKDDKLEAVRSGRWKLRTGSSQLYDLEADLGETTDVATAHPDVVARLAALAETARADLGDATTGQPGANVRPVGRR